MELSAFIGALPTADLSAERIPTYSVCELNSAIASLLDRGFAPRFLVEASVSRPQVKKGHLWLTLSDGDASISAVVWASRLKQLSFQPSDGDGVTVVGKLNFWTARANLNVQVLDIRPSLTTVLRQFEQVRTLLTAEGLISDHRRRVLPQRPANVAILTSVPSSALADMLRTSRERWPMTRLWIIPIPVQGAVADRIRSVIATIAQRHKEWSLDAIVLARGGGSREDLSVFDDEQLCRQLAELPIPLVTGLGHEDDLTVADLVADHRAATPTAALVALLPDRNEAVRQLMQRRQRLGDHRSWWIKRQRQQLNDKRQLLQLQSPRINLKRRREALDQKRRLLQALSPERWLKRGLALVSDANGTSLIGTKDVSPGDILQVQLSDGSLETRVERVHHSSPPSAS